MSRPRTEEDEDNVHNEAEEEGAAAAREESDPAGDDLATIRNPREAATVPSRRQWAELGRRLFPGVLRTRDEEGMVSTVEIVFLVVLALPSMHN